MCGLLLGAWCLLPGKASAVSTRAPSSESNLVGGEFFPGVGNIDSGTVLASQIAVEGDDDDDDDEDGGNDDGDDDDDDDDDDDERGSTTTTEPRTTTTAPTTTAPTTTTSSITTTTTTAPSTTAATTTTTTASTTTASTTTAPLATSAPTTTTRPPTTTAVPTTTTAPTTTSAPPATAPPSPTTTYASVIQEQAPPAEAAQADLNMSLRPRAGSPGATLDMSFSFPQAANRPASIQIMMGDSALGAPVPTSGARFSARRTVPDLPPATYQVTAVSAGQVLARADFEVLEPTATGYHPAVVVGLAVVLLGVGWQAARGLSRPAGAARTLGPVDAWYSWRARHRR